MAVRNFWVEADVDGYKTMLDGGPRSKDGGMDVTIYQRDDGCIKTAVRIFCRAYGDKLITTVRVDDEEVAVCESER